MFKNLFLNISFSLQSQVKEYEAVLARLKFYKSFYLTLVALEKSEVCGILMLKFNNSTIFYFLHWLLTFASYFQLIF